jgi:hypothetical protein
MQRTGTLRVQALFGKGKKAAPAKAAKAAVKKAVAAPRKKNGGERAARSPRAALRTRRHHIPGRAQRGCALGRPARPRGASTRAPRPNLRRDGPVNAPCRTISHPAAPAADPLWLPNTERPAWLDGSLPGDRGFDPLGLSKPVEYLQVRGCRFLRVRRGRRAPPPAASAASSASFQTPSS